MTTPTADLGTAAAVLAAACESRWTADREEANLLQYAVHWAAMHSTESLEDAAAFCGPPGCEEDIPIAGEGAPLVAEFCVAEFAAALNLSTDAGRKYLGNAVELRYRLPRVWGRVVAGDLRAWRARSIADKTMTLTPSAATWVDRQIAPFAHKIGPVQLDRLIDAALAEFMPEEAEARRQRAAEQRKFDIHLGDADTTGTVWVDGALDLADALDLEAAVSATARELAELGCAESLDVRRSMAVGEIARRDRTLEFPTEAELGAEVGGRVASASRLRVETSARKHARRRAGRRVVLYAHVSEAAVLGTGSGSRTLGRCGNTRTPVLVTQIQQWCGDAEKVTVKPVIDLAGHDPVDAYEAPDRHREQIALRDGHCVFPWCNRLAVNCDSDHVVPYPDGPTCPCNLAPTCRRHHRHKTHAGWTNTVLKPGTYLWRSPHGHHYLVDGTGTEPADP